MDDYDTPQQPFRKRPRFNQHQGHPHRHQQNYHHQSQPESYTIEERIAKLGETGSRNDEIGALAADIRSDLMSRGQDEEASQEAIKVLTSKICRCIVSFPTRIGTYATLIGLISVKHYNVACQIINTLHASYPVYLEAQKWNEALTIIHLLSSLVNCNVIRPSALLSQYEFLLEVTQDDKCPQARSDYFVYTVMSSLPFVAFELAKAETQEMFEKILTTIEVYLSKRSKKHLNVIRVWTSNESTVQMDYLDSLWVQIKNFKANNWVETFLHRPYNHKENKDLMVASLIPANSPTFQIPGHNNKCFYPSPRVVFRLFEDDVAEGPVAIPGSDKIERFCIENHIRGLIDEISTQPYNCARHLANMYNSENIPLKHILIETVLGELFNLPKPKHPEILYQSLLFDFAKIFFTSRQPDELKYNYDVVLNEAVKILFDNLESMNVTCLTRFVSWFSFHLNNTEFVYPWQTWADATSKKQCSSKAVFVHDILERCIRFSFHKKIATVLNDNLTELMPDEPSVSYKPVFPDNPKAQELEATIKKLIMEKADGKTICETLNIIIDGVELPEDFTPKEEKHSEKLLKIDIFTAVILSIASKSLTHLSSAIGKYRNVFKALTKIANGQIQLLETIHSCSEKHPQLQIILVDKLLKAELVGAKEVVDWIFSASMRPFHLKSYTWELLNITTSRLQQNIDKLTTEQGDLKEDDEEAEAKVNAKASAGDSGRPTTPTAAADEDNDANADNGGNGDVEMKEDEATRKQAVKKEKETLDEKIALARNSIKELLVHIFSMFAGLLADHIKQCESSGVSYMDDHFKWVTGRMQEVYYNHIETVREIYDKVGAIVDGVPSIGNSIINLNQ